jgi:hypothetical protein
MVEAALQEQLLNLAVVIPVTVAEARQAAGASVAGHSKHTSKHGLAPEATSAAMFAAVRAALMGALEGFDEALQRRRGVVAGLLDGRAAAAMVQFNSAAEAPVGCGQVEQFCAEEDFAWLAHSAERAKQWLQL